jgi:hypothetical protein
LTWARREKKKPIGSIGEIKLEREETPIVCIDICFVFFKFVLDTTLALTPEVFRMLRDFIKRAFCGRTESVQKFFTNGP